MNINRILLTMLIFFIVILGCDSLSLDAKRHALSYFYGKVEGIGGMAISSWDGADREKFVNFEKAVYELGDEWNFYEDNLHFTETDNYEFIIRYKTIFKNKITYDFFVVSTVYFTDFGEEPIPLKEETFFFDFEKSETQEVSVLTLWQGDFDGILEKYKRNDQDL